MWTLDAAHLQRGIHHPRFESVCSRCPWPIQAYASNKLYHATPSLSLTPTHIYSRFPCRPDDRIRLFPVSSTSQLILKPSPNIAVSPPFWPAHMHWACRTGRGGGCGVNVEDPEARKREGCRICDVFLCRSISLAWEHAQQQSCSGSRPNLRLSGSPCTLIIH